MIGLNKCYNVRMDRKTLKHYLPNILPAVVVFVLLGGFAGYQFMEIRKLQQNVGVLNSELASTTIALKENTGELSKYIVDLRKETTGLSSTLSTTQRHIDEVKNQVGGVEQTLGTVSGTVGTLEKLSRTDPELLKKYSKVYFLNENYKPVYLTQIPSEYTYSANKIEQFNTEAWPFLKFMLDSAKNSGVTIYVKSAYRSFDEQESLKSYYTVVYGAGTANSFSADQGYSEHQMGTTADFITTGLGGQLSGFDKTDAYKWMLENAHKFGFTLSYPKNNSHYIFEPWHWRFVGVKLATYLHDNNLNFYDMDQREIDKYLINIFD